jgi:hypothetical protein
MEQKVKDELHAISRAIEHNQNQRINTKWEERVIYDENIASLKKDIDVILDRWLDEQKKLNHV